MHGNRCAQPPKMTVAVTTPTKKSALFARQSSELKMASIEDCLDLCSSGACAPGRHPLPFRERKDGAPPECERMPRERVARLYDDGMRECKGSRDMLHHSHLRSHPFQAPDCHRHSEFELRFAENLPQLDGQPTDRERLLDEVQPFFQHPMRGDHVGHVA